MKKRFLTPLTLLMACALSVTPVYAKEKTYDSEVTSSLAVGNLDVVLSVDEGASGNKRVLPGEAMEHKVSIKNNGNSAWIRATMSCVSKEGEALEDDGLFPVMDGWVEKGDYYYRTEPLKEGETAVLIEEVMLPEEINAYKSRTFSLEVSVDAVQEAHFQPDFAEIDPWFGTVIEASAKTGAGKKGTESGEFHVTFENSADGFVKTSEDFFEHFDALMPGDTVTDTLHLKNNYQRTVTLSLKSDLAAGQSAEAEELLKDVGLALKKGDAVLYDGALLGDGIKAGVELSRLSQGETADILFSLSLPKELSSKAALMVADVKWTFTAAYEEYSGSSGGGGGGGSQVGGHGYKPPTGGPGEALKPQETLPPNIDEAVSEQVDAGGGAGKGTGVNNRTPKMGEDSLLPTILVFTGSGLVLLFLLLRKFGKMRSVKQVFSKVISGVSVLLCIVVFFTAFTMVAPKAFGINPYIVMSGSMEPSIHTGSMILVNRKISPENIRVDDVITYALTGEGSEVTHRVIAVDEENGTLITKGDANEVEDMAPVSFSQVIGKCMISIPYLGYFASALMGEFRWYIIGGIIGALVLLYFLGEMLKDEDAEADKETEKEAQQEEGTEADDKEHL